MKLKKSLLLALTAGAVAPVAANAQLVEGAENFISSRNEIRSLVLNPQGQLVEVPSSSNFSQRGIVTVYDAFPTDTRTASIGIMFFAFTGVPLVGEDISFANSVWATTPGRIEQFVVPVGRVTTNLVPVAQRITNADLRISMFDTGSMTANPMVSGTPFFDAIAQDIGAQVNGFAANALFQFTFTPANPPQVPSNDPNIFLTYAWTTATPGTGNAGTTVLPGPNFTPAFQGRFPYVFWGWYNQLPNSRGATDEGLAMDWNGNGILEGGTRVDTADPGRVQNASEHRRVFINPTTTPPAPSTNFGGRLHSVMSGAVDQATQDLLRPTADQNLGTLADGETVSNVVAVGSGSSNFRERAAWYVFNLAGDITDAAGTWLDIDMEPTANIATNPADLDPVMALYDNNGDLLTLGSNAGIDDDNGTGLLSQLSFGIGLRPPNGVGTGGDIIRNFDGIEGQLFSASGPFWLGVIATQPLYTIEDGWSLEQSSSTTGSVQVRFRTNVNGPLPLDPAVPPFVDQELVLPGGFAGDPVSAPGVQGTPGLPGDPGYRVYQFTTCKNIDASDPETTDWLDLDFDTSVGVDPVAFVFNSSGFLVAQNDDGNAAGGYFKPQLSFGNAGPRPAAGAAAGALPYTGQNGGLPAGTYYVIVAFFGAEPLATQDRFHIRPETPNSNVNVNVFLNTGLVAGDCSAAGCDTIDFNGNGVFPEDQDVIDFFLVLSGGECPTGTCSDIDFNNNGVFPEDQDVIDFFNVLSGGTCP